jgi:hypothetical protein
MEIPEILPSFDHLAISFLKRKSWPHYLWQKVFIYDDVDFRFRVSVTPAQPGHDEIQYVYVEAPRLDAAAYCDVKKLPTEWQALSFEFKQIVEMILIQQVHQS